MAESFVAFAGSYHMHFDDLNGGNCSMTDRRTEKLESYCMVATGDNNSILGFVEQPVQVLVEVMEETLEALHRFLLVDFLN